MVQPSPLFDARLIIEALNVPVAIVVATTGADSAGDAGLVYYAVSEGFQRLYGGMFTESQGRAPTSPSEWRGLSHTEIFPVLQDPEHEWAIQLLGALNGTSTGWVDVAWDASAERTITVAYQLTAIHPGWVGVEAVDLAGHAARILGGVDNA